MGRLLLIFVSLLYLDGCQSAGLFNTSGMGSLDGEANSASSQERREEETVSAAEAPANPETGGVSNSVATAGTTYATPPTTAAPPRVVTPGNITFKFENLVIADPANYPEENLLLKGYLVAVTPGANFDTVEVTVHLPNKQSIAVELMPGGCFSTFFSGAPGTTISVSGMVVTTTTLEPIQDKTLMIPNGLLPSDLEPCSTSWNAPAPASGTFAL